MHSTLPRASASSRSSLVSLVTLLFAVPAAFFIYLVVHGPGLESHVFPEHIADVVRTVVLTTRELGLELLAKTPIGTPCELGELCRAGQARPTLEDGSPSHAVWDLPRKLMRDEFKDVQRIIPNAKVNYIWKEPLVVYFDDVLSAEEINLLIESATPRFQKSMVVDKDGKPQADTSRTSSTAWLYTHENPAFKTIVSRVAALAGFTDRHAEHIGVNRYQAEQYFNPHHDFLKEEQLNFGEFPGCQRTSTVLIYLTDVEDGGETIFVRKGSMDGSWNFDSANPDHLAIKPKRGRVLVWYDMHPYTEKIDYRTLHGGSPVAKGVKMAATVFIRNCTKAWKKPPAPVPPPPKEDL